MPWCLEEVWPGCWLRGSSADHFEEVTLIERDVYLTNMEVEERRRKRQYFEIRRETDAQTGTRVAKVLMEVFNRLARRQCCLAAGASVSCRDDASTKPRFTRT